MEDFYRIQECPQGTASVSYDTWSNPGACSTNPSKVQLTHFPAPHQIEQLDPTSTVYSGCQESLQGSSGTRDSSSIIGDPDFLEVIRASEPSEVIGLGVYQVQETQSSSSGSTLEETQSPQLITGTNPTPGPSPRSTEVLSPSQSTGFILLQSDSSTFEIVRYTLLNRHSTNSALESPSSEERKQAITSIYTAWQHHSDLQRILATWMELPNMAGLQRPFFPQGDEEPFIQSKKWTSGADVSIFARSKRLFPDQDPILCPYQLRGSANTFYSYNLEGNDQVRVNNAFGELRAVLSYRMTSLAPEFDKLATAFFNGDPIPEDLEDIPTPSETFQLEVGFTGKNHVINYDTSDWKRLLEQDIQDDPLMVRFLVDVILCNKMEEICRSRNLTYYNATVHRDSSYRMVVDALNVAESRQIRLNESTSNDPTWHVTLVRRLDGGADNQPEASENAGKSVEFADALNSLSEDAAGKTKKKKNPRRKGKSKNGKAAVKAPVQGANAEENSPKPRSDQVEDERLSDQDSDTPLDLSPRSEREVVAQPISPKDRAAITPAPLEVQEASADAIQDTNGGSDWNIVRPKTSHRAKGASRGSSRGGLRVSTGDLQGRARSTSYQIPLAQKSLQNKNLLPNQRDDSKPKETQTPRAPENQKTQHTMTDNHSMDLQEKSNETRDALQSGTAAQIQPEKLRIFNPEEYPAIPSKVYSTPNLVSTTTNNSSVASTSNVSNTGSQELRLNKLSTPNISAGPHPDDDILPASELILPLRAQDELGSRKKSDVAGEEKQSTTEDSSTGISQETVPISRQEEKKLQQSMDIIEVPSEAIKTVSSPNHSTSSPVDGILEEVDGGVEVASPLRETESRAESSEVWALSSIFKDLGSPTKFDNSIRPASLPERNDMISDDDEDNKDNIDNSFDVFRNRSRTISNNARGAAFFQVDRRTEKHKSSNDNDTHHGGSRTVQLQFGAASPVLKSFASVSDSERSSKPSNFVGRIPIFQHNGRQVLESGYMDPTSLTLPVTNSAQYGHSGHAMHTSLPPPTHLSTYQSDQSLEQGAPFQHNRNQTAALHAPITGNATRHFTGVPHGTMYQPPHLRAPFRTMIDPAPLPIPPSGHVLDPVRPIKPAIYTDINLNPYPDASGGPAFATSQWHSQDHRGANMEERAANYEPDAASDSPVSPASFWCQGAPAPEIIYNCTFCTERITATIQTPLVLCSGCGPSCTTYYCSVECLLVDALTHSSRCLRYPASVRAAYHNLPPQYLYLTDPLYLVEGPIESPENFRQRNFALHCSSGPFPKLLQAWAKVHGLPQNLEGHDISESTKRTGDYYIFRSRKTADGLRPNPDSDVICTIILRNGDPLKAMLHRTLNACFLSYHPPLIEFLFRMLRHLLMDTTFFELLPHSCSQDMTLSEFHHQFLREFRFDAAMQLHHTDDFNANMEWGEIFGYIASLESRYPVLDGW